MCFFSVFISFFGYHFIIIIVIFSFRAETHWEAIIASKNDIIASKDKTVQLVEEAMKKVIAASDKAIASKDESLKLAGGIIAKLNTELIVAKGLVEPRCVNHVNSFV